jgi:DNA polymerase-3 subunit alpha
MANIETLLDEVAAEKASRRFGQQSLFGADDELPRRYSMERHPEWPQRELLRLEKEALGIFFSGHPLDEYRDLIARKATVRLGDLDNGTRAGSKGERPVTAIGVIGEVREIQTRDGRQMAFAGLEDDSGAAELVIFADPFSAGRALLESGAVVAATGTVDRSRGAVKLLVDNLCEPHQVPDRTQRALHLRVRASATEDELFDLRERCIAAPGQLDLFIHYMGTSGEVVIKASAHLKVGADDAFLHSLSDIPFVSEAWTE